MSDPNPPVVVDVRALISRDPAQTHALTDRVRLLLRDGCNYILLNVAQLSYADSLTLGAIVQAYATAVRQGALLKIVNPTPRLRELLAVTKLDRVIETAEQPRSRK